jgi:hypothetical protein
MYPGSRGVVDVVVAGSEVVDEVNSVGQVVSSIW